VFESECGLDAMSLIGSEGFDVAHALCFSNEPFDAGAGDPACGAERPTCSKMLGRCCTGIVSAARCTAGTWTCDADHTLTSECRFDLLAAFRGDYGGARAADFCYASGDAGVGDAAIPDAGASDASSADAGDAGAAG